jgi:hypothetical protein
MVRSALMELAWLVMEGRMEPELGVTYAAAASEAL